MSGEGGGDPRFDARLRGRVPPLRVPSYAPGTVLRVTPIIPPPLRRETAERPQWQPRAVVIPPPVPSGSTLPHEAEGEPDASGLPHEADGDL